MIELLLVSVSLRFLLFEHYSFKWFRFLLGKVLFFAPDYWQALESCAYCNGFWVSALGYFVVIGLHKATDSCWLAVFALVGAYVNYLVQMVVNILEAAPANKVA